MTAARSAVFQTTVVVGHWLATGVGILIAVAMAITTPSAEVALSSVLGAIACLLGAFMATSLARRKVADAQFFKGTTVARAIAVAWLLIPVAILGGALFGYGGVVGRYFDENFANIIAVGSIIGVLGPGYSEYRLARDAASAAP